VVVWDAKAGTQHKAYAHHSGSVVDADWRNNTMFASAAQDGSIAVCKLSDSKPLRHWQVDGRVGKGGRGRGCGCAGGCGQAH
jgi:transducin (beta)-like 1